jgi:hypothetical protein
VYDEYKPTSSKRLREQTGSKKFFVAFQTQTPAQAAVPAPSAEPPPAAEQCGLVRERFHQFDLVFAGAPAPDGL